MTLKDWTKGKYKNQYVNKSTKETIILVFDYMGYEDKWLVAIQDENVDMIADKAFKTKSQALKFAKSYMEKH